MVQIIDRQQGEKIVKRDDPVSRAAVIELVKELDGGRESSSIDEILEQVKTLPSAIANPIPAPACESLQAQRFLHRAKDTRSGMTVEGFYCNMAETTYAFEDDYRKFPVSIHHYMVVEEMTDWGLPNKLRLYPIDPDTLQMFSGLYDKKQHPIWEYDHVISAGRTAIVRFGYFGKEGLSGWFLEYEDGSLELMTEPAGLEVV